MVRLIQNVRGNFVLLFFLDFLIEQIYANISIRTSHSRKVHRSHNLDSKVNVQNKLVM